MFSFILSFLLLNANASAFPIMGWQCKARGMDRYERRYEVVGRRQVIQQDAAASALRRCQEAGYLRCQVFFCTDVDDLGR